MMSQPPPPTNHVRDFKIKWRTKRLGKVARGKRPPWDLEERVDLATARESNRAALEHEFAKRIGLDEYPEQ